MSPALKRRSATECTPAASSCVAANTRMRSVRMKGSVVGRGCGAQDESRRFIDVRRTLGDRGVRTGDPGGSTGPGLEGLPEANLEIREAAVWPLAVPEARVDFRVRLEPQRRPEQSTAGLLQRQARTHNLRGLFPGAREDLRERNGPALGAGQTPC